MSPSANCSCHPSPGGTNPAEAEEHAQQRDHRERRDHFPEQDGPDAVAFAREGGAERHASPHRAPGQERHAPENGPGKLRHDITEGRPQIELAHQAERQRHDGVDVRAAPFPDRGERDQRTGGAEQEAGDQPAPSFARQDARNGTAFPEHQNHERKADQHQRRRPDQFGTKDQPGNVGWTSSCSVDGQLSLDSTGHFAALAPLTRVLIRYNPLLAVMKSVRLS